MKRIKIKYLAISFILVLALILAGGCAESTETDNSPAAGAPAAESRAAENGPPPGSATTANVTPAVTGEAKPAPLSEAALPAISPSPSPALPSVAEVVARVKPAVVVITTEVAQRDIFGRTFTREGGGSGWIIGEEGTIVTNNHVVAEATSVTVVLDDGRAFAAEVVGTDSLTDLAVLKIDAQNLPALTVGDSDRLRVGDWVVAIGNSLGQGTSATSGIVSALKVSLSESPGQTILDLVQTDAAINPGNSGGPLVNMAGEVIGINSVKIVLQEVEGMGYAISSNEALPIIENLVTRGYVVRPWLGVSLYTVDQYAVMRYGLAVDKGSLIATLAAGSPADKAGLKTGDVIVSLNGRETANTQQLIRAINAANIGQSVEIVFWRGESQNTTTATLIESPPPP